MAKLTAVQAMALDKKISKGIPADDIKLISAVLVAEFDKVSFEPTAEEASAMKRMKWFEQEQNDGAWVVSTKGKKNCLKSFSIKGGLTRRARMALDMWSTYN